MRITLSLIIMLLCLGSQVTAQIKAVTEDGKIVILNMNGTWKFQDEESNEITEIPMSNIRYTKDTKANFLLKSKKTNFGFWINPQKWTITPSTKEEATEYGLRLKDEDLFALILTEKIEVPLETLKNIALKNAKEAAPDATIAKEEYRVVNGKKVLMLTITRNIQGINFIYFGYYYSSKSGTVQFLTYPAQNMYDGYLSECETLLNGLVDITENNR